MLHLCLITSFMPNQKTILWKQYGQARTQFHCGTWSHKSNQRLCATRCTWCNLNMFASNTEHHACAILFTAKGKLASAAPSCWQARRQSCIHIHVHELKLLGKQKKKVIWRKPPHNRGNHRCVMTYFLFGCLYYNCGCSFAPRISSLWRLRTLLPRTTNQAAKVMRTRAFNTCRNACTQTYCAITLTANSDCHLPLLPNATLPLHILWLRAAGAIAQDSAKIATVTLQPSSSRGCRRSSGLHKTSQRAIMSCVTTSDTLIQHNIFFVPMFTPKRNPLCDESRKPHSITGVIKKEFKPHVHISCPFFLKHTCISRHPAIIHCNYLSFHDIASPWQQW